MQVTRCPTCGETRWSLTGLTLERATACAMCGDETVPERRWPGRTTVSTTPVADERRAATTSTA